MPYTLEQYSNPPAILYHSQPNSNLVGELPDMVADMLAALDSQPEPVYHILDFTHVNLEMDDLVVVANRISRGDRPPLHHPNVRQNVFITTNPMIRLALDGMTTADVFGMVKLVVFETRDQAFDYCRAQVGQSQA